MATDNPAFKEHQFKPGDAWRGNAGGRPRRRPQSDANMELLRSPLPEFLRRAINNRGILLEKNCTWAQAIAVSMGKKALAGHPEAAKELRESTEGRAMQRIEMAGDQPLLNVRVSFEPAPTGPRAKHYTAPIDLSAEPMRELPAAEPEQPTAVATENPSKPVEPQTP